MRQVDLAGEPTVIRCLRLADVYERIVPAAAAATSDVERLSTRRALARARAVTDLSPS
jgi:hypothetical protein